MANAEKYLLRNLFHAGIVRDAARHAVPLNGVYDALDFLLDRIGLAYKRGGSAFQSSELADETLVIGCAAPEFAGDPRVLEWASDGTDLTLYDATTDTAVEVGDMNAAAPTENPPLYFDKVIITDGRGVYPPQKIYLDTGAVTIADLGGFPPVARVSCVHLDYLVLASSVDNPNRLWFSPIPVLEPTLYAITAATAGAPGTIVISGDHIFEFFPAIARTSTNPGSAGATFHISGSTGNDGYYSVVTSSFDGTDTTITVDDLPDGTDDGFAGISWDVFDGYIDCAAPITGLASVAGILVVFMRGQWQRILGSVPPGLPGENMELQPGGPVGCIDARSIVQADGVVFFANEHGVYETNGSGEDSITTKADGNGIGSLWTAYMEGFAPALGAVVCLGQWLNRWLLITIHHAADDIQEGARFGLLYHIPTGAWSRLSDGVTADMYATRFAPVGEIYAACGDVADPVRLLKLSGIFDPTADNASDANGEAVEPLLEVPFGDAGLLKQFPNGRLTYRLTDTAELLVAVSPGLVGSAFATVLTVPASTEPTRPQFDILADDAQAVTVRVTQSGASAATELFAVDADVTVYEPRVTGGQ